MKEKTTMICLDCERTFKRIIGKKTVEVKCPKCGSYDTDVNGYEYAKPVNHFYNPEP